MTSSIRPTRPANAVFESSVENGRSRANLDPDQLVDFQIVGGTLSSSGQRPTDGQPIGRTNSAVSLPHSHCHCIRPRDEGSSTVVASAGTLSSSVAPAGAESSSRSRRWRRMSAQWAASRFPSGSDPPAAAQTTIDCLRRSSARRSHSPSRCAATTAPPAPASSKASRISLPACKTCTSNVAFNCASTAGQLRYARTCPRRPRRRDQPTLGPARRFGRQPIELTEQIDRNIQLVANGLPIGVDRHDDALDRPRGQRPRPVVTDCRSPWRAAQSPLRSTDSRLRAGASWPTAEWTFNAPFRADHAGDWAGHDYQQQAHGDGPHNARSMTGRTMGAIGRRRHRPERSASGPRLSSASRRETRR